MKEEWKTLLKSTCIQYIVKNLILKPYPSYTNSFYSLSILEGDFVTQFHKVRFVLFFLGEGTTTPMNILFLGSGSVM